MKIEYSYKLSQLDDFFKKIILNIKEKKINLNMNNKFIHNL
jgi:hypothetical protein